ncbi:HD domain-containing phosphohydrolase [Dongia sp.]|uniref:HD domain-containing phosphohydrolase n=1 Tax=Dongia sp. TaxID=1977262 RepID=UPI0035B28EA6
MNAVLSILNSGGSALIFLLIFLSADLAAGYLVKRRHQTLVRNILLVLFGPATIYFHSPGATVGPHGHADINVVLDQRGAAIALATMFGGFAVGFLAMLAEMAMRVIIGGRALGADLVGIVGDLLLCWGAIRIMQRGKPLQSIGFGTLFVCGGVVGFGEAAALLLIGTWTEGLLIFRHDGLSLFLVQALSALIFGIVIKIQTDIRAARAETELEKTFSRKARLEEEAFRAGAITATTDSILKLDLQGRIVDVSDAYVRWSGYSRDELIGMPIRERNSEMTDEQIAAGLRDIVVKGKIIFETAHRRKDGSSLPVEIVAVHSPEGKGAIIVFMRDIRDRKLAEARQAEKNASLKESLEQAIRALSAAMMHRDLSTASHEDRVADLSLAIGRKMALDPERLEGLGLAAMVHDIGQIQTPSEILMRPYRLSPEEFALVKMHAEAGAQILGDIKFPWPIAEMVHQHHENFDGSGYPRGLTGDQILLEARIIRVADSVEAMLSHRPFRRSRDRAYALAELRSGSGSKYDPDVVAACVDLLENAGYQFKTTRKAAE